LLRQKQLTSLGSIYLAFIFTNRSCSSSSIFFTSSSLRTLGRTKGLTAGTACLSAWPGNGLRGGDVPSSDYLETTLELYNKA